MEGEEGIFQEDGRSGDERMKSKHKREVQAEVPSL